MLLAEHLPHIDWDDLYSNLRTSGRQFDMVFNPVTLLPNSRRVLEASEFARDQGCYAAFHDAVFKAYFTDLQDIGNSGTILQLAARSGLNAVELEAALAQQRYLPRLQEVTDRAHRLGINSAPTFIINEDFVVTGAQPLEAFRDILGKIVSGEA